MELYDANKKNEELLDIIKSLKSERNNLIDERKNYDNKLKELT